MTKEPIFCDTSIIVAGRLNHDLLMERISERLSNHSLKLTGSVVIGEYKRRVLKDARYLLELFVSGKTCHEVQQHVLYRLSGQFHHRKRQICMALLEKMFTATNAVGKIDVDREAKAIAYLRAWIEYSLRLIAKKFEIVTKAGCAFSSAEIKIKKKSYEFSDVKCSKQKDCEVGKFFELNRNACQQLLDYFGDLQTPKTDEIVKIESLLRTFLTDPSVNIVDSNPCTDAGDLLIALESFPIKNFYTMNWKESRHLCRALKQTLIVRNSNPDEPEVVCETSKDFDHNYG